jgi:hypothetical protein
MDGELAIAPDRAVPATTVLRVAAATTVVSGTIAAIGMVFLVAMFAAFAVDASGPALVLGRINDIAVLLSYLLCAPSVLAVRQLLGPRRPLLGTLTAILGLGSIAAIVVLQGLLIAGIMTFEEQVGLVSIGLLGLGAWFVGTGQAGASSGVLPHGLRMGVLAATYVGYPVWAVWLRRSLRRPDGPAQPSR